MKTNEDLKLLVYIGGGILFFPLIKSLVGLTSAGASATTGIITALDPNAVSLDNLNNAPRIYENLMKRPPNKLSNGSLPSMKRYLTDEECRNIANEIEQSLSGVSSDYESIRTLLRSVSPFGVPDLRRIYAEFGNRREYWAVAGGSRKNLFQWLKDNLTSNELKIARQTWNPANILPNL